MPNRRTAYCPYALPSRVTTARELPKAGQNVRFVGGHVPYEQR